MRILQGGAFELAVVIAVLAVVSAEPRVYHSLANTPSPEDRLLLAAWTGDDALFDVSVADGALPSARDATGVTPLHLASISGNTRLARRLVAMGADVDATDQWGSTPLMYAALNDRDGVVEYLLTEGADPSRQGMDSRITALDIASRWGSHRTAALLRRWRADHPRR